MKADAGIPGDSELLSRERTDQRNPTPNHGLATDGTGFSDRVEALKRNIKPNPSSERS
jgi:hypothetical protein